MFEIGKSLHDARMRRGLDIADCERETKIRGKYLRALEEEEFVMLPDPAYVKGFLRAYGEFLDVDPQLLLDEYVSRFEPAGENHEVNALPARRSSSRSVSRSTRMPQLSSAPRAPRSAVRRRGGLPLIALAIGAAVAVGVIVWLGTGGSGSSAGEEPVVAGTAIAGGHRLSVTGDGGASSLEVRRAGPAGAVLYRGTVHDGERRTFSAGRLWVRVGAGANVRVVVDGRQVAPRGGQGYVVTSAGLVPV